MSIDKYGILTLRPKTIARVRSSLPAAEARDTIAWAGMTALPIPPRDILTHSQNMHNRGQEKVETIEQEFDESQEDTRLKSETAEEVEEVSETEAREEDRQKEVVEESKVGPTTVRPGDGLLKLMIKNQLLTKAPTSPVRVIHFSGTLQSSLTAPDHTESQTPKAAQKRVTQPKPLRVEDDIQSRLEEVLKISVTCHSPTKGLLCLQASCASARTSAGIRAAAGAVSGDGSDKVTQPHHLPPPYPRRRSLRLGVQAFSDTKSWRLGALPT